MLSSVLLLRRRSSLSGSGRSSSLCSSPAPSSSSLEATRTTPRCDSARGLSVVVAAFSRGGSELLRACLRFSRLTDSCLRQNSQPALRPHSSGLNSIHSLHGQIACEPQPFWKAPRAAEELPFDLASVCTARGSQTHVTNACHSCTRAYKGRPELGSCVDSARENPKASRAILFCVRIHCYTSDLLSSASHC